MGIIRPVGIRQKHCPVKLPESKWSYIKKWLLTAALAYSAIILGNSAGSQSRLLMIRLLVRPRRRLKPCVLRVAMNAEFTLFEAQDANGQVYMVSMWT